MYSFSSTWNIMHTGNDLHVQYFPWCLIWSRDDILIALDIRIKPKPKPNQIKSSIFVTISASRPEPPSHAVFWGARPTRVDHPGPNQQGKPGQPLLLFLYQRFFLALRYRTRGLSLSNVHPFCLFWPRAKPNQIPVMCGVTYLCSRCHGRNCYSPQLPVAMVLT